MNKYDCVIIGNDIYSLTVALFLARKMRKVLIVQDPQNKNSLDEKITITDPENRKFNFSHHRQDIITGLDESGLLREYFDDLGILNSIKATKIDYDIVVNDDNSLRRRFVSFEQLRVYLIRYYPRSRNQIYRFFNDLNSHYENYIQQFYNMLKNKEYTLSSLMIQWGDYSLKELLNKYFANQKLIDEFHLCSEINGLDFENINAYNFFSNYFIGLKEGFYYLRNSQSEIYDILLAKLEIIYPNVVLKTKIKEFLIEDKKITSIIDSSGNIIEAKYFFVSDNPLNFYSKNFKDIEEDLQIIKGYYPNTDTDYMYNTLYLATNQKLKSLGIKDSIYYFKNNDEEGTKIIKMIDYGYLHQYDQRKNIGSICVDYAFDNKKGGSRNDILKRLYELFPKLKNNVVGVKEGTPKKYMSMLADHDMRKNLDINEQIDVESIEHIQVFKNLFVGGEFMRPEAGLFGMFNQAFMFGDKIEDRLHYGEDEDNFYYLSNDELIMMVRHNYDHKYLGNNEIHINFHIGKEEYFVRTKGKNIEMHHGRYAHADLSIYTTNDTLANLLLKKVTFEEVLSNDSLKFRGDKDLLFNAVKAFNLDDYRQYNPEDYIKSKYKNLGLKFFFGYMLIYGTACFLSNFIYNTYIFLGAFLLTLGLTILRRRAYDENNWFEYLLNFIMLGTFVTSIFWSTLNNLRSDNWFLGAIILVMMISVFANKPIIYMFHKYDYNFDYRNSSLFKTINNGLTFFWGFIFLTILGGAFISGERYVSAWYFVIFLGFILTYYYPIIYVRTNIKK